MTAHNVGYGTYVALAVTALQSLTNDNADTFSGWQSTKVSNLSDLAIDREFIIDLSTAATGRADDKAAYVFLVPWVTTDGGTTWITGANFGTITLPTGTDSTCVITEPNSLRLAAVLPYKDTSQRMQGAFSVVSVLGWMPDAVSIAIRNCSGAALGTGCVVAHRPLNFAST
jgi:hypothetical protein